MGYTNQKLKSVDISRDIWRDIKCKFMKTTLEMEIKMKYYSEDEMKDIRAAFEEKILAWPDVTTRKMFGCPCYKADNKLFAFLVTGGVVLTKLSEADRGSLSAIYRTEPFQAGKRTVNNWPRVPVFNKVELPELIPFVEKSYTAALIER